MIVKRNGIEEEKRRNELSDRFYNGVEQPFRRQYNACNKCPICHSTNFNVNCDKRISKSDYFYETYYSLSFSCNDCKSEWVSDPFWINIRSSRFKVVGSSFELDSYDSAREKKQQLKNKAGFILFILIPIVISIILGIRFGLVVGVVGLLILGFISFSIWGRFDNEDPNLKDMKREMEGENNLIRSTNINECYVSISDNDGYPDPLDIHKIIDKIENTRC